LDLAVGNSRRGTAALAVSGDEIPLARRHTEYGKSVRERYPNLS
jgi:hypothetical protein